MRPPRSAPDISRRRCRRPRPSALKAGFHRGPPDPLAKLAAVFSLERSASMQSLSSPVHQPLLRSQSPFFAMARSPSRRVYRQSASLPYSSLIATHLQSAIHLPFSVNRCCPIDPHALGHTLFYHLRQKKGLRMRIWTPLLELDQIPRL
jgi:hypothetical protein